MISKNDDIGNCILVCFMKECSPNFICFLKMGKTLYIFISFCVFFLILNYFGISKIPRNGNKVIFRLISAIARDKDLDDIVPRNTLGLDIHINQRKERSNLIKNGIYWSDFAESFVPAGWSVEKSNKTVSYLRSQDVKSLTTANKTNCGYRNNGNAVLNDGTRMCVRHNKNEFRVQGATLAFYLSRMLQMDNVPVMFLARINDSTSLWRQLNSSTLRWKTTATVEMIKWIPDARERCHLPHILKEAYRTRQPITQAVIRTSDLAEDPVSIAQLIQIGTSIIFDFLVCQRDRLHQWRHLHKKHTWIHNIVQSPNGKIWLIDHESAFSCLGGHHNLATKAKAFHNKMLKTMCVFQSSLVTALQVLSENISAFKKLLNYTKSFEPLLNTIHLYTNDRSDVFSSKFDDRLAYIIEWIETCKENYTRNRSNKI